MSMSTSTFLAVRVGATAFDVLVALLATAHLGRRPGRLWLATRVALALLIAGASYALKAPLLWAIGVRYFGFIHLAYLDLLVLPPLVVLAAYLLDRRRGAVWARGRWSAVGVAIAALAAPAVGAHATLVAPFDLRLETARIPLPPSRRPPAPVRVGVLADIQTAHVTAHEHRAVDRLMAERPDLILLPGDLFQGAPAAFEAQLAGLRALLGKLSAPGGVFFAIGDTDRQPQLERVLAGSRVRLLLNEAHRTVIHGQPVTIAGIERDWFAPAAAAVVRSLEAPGDDIRILVSHRPDSVLTLPRPTRVDLVVAGHTHGGQVQLPLLGPPIISSNVPRRVGAGGFHLVDGRPIYVSRGVGLERGQAPRIRFLCPPEASLLLLGAPAP
jgi:uncharacterized protein